MSKVEYREMLHTRLDWEYRHGQNGQGAVDIQTLILITKPYEMPARYKIIGANFLTRSNKVVDGRENL